MGTSRNSADPHSDAYVVIDGAVIPIDRVAVGQSLLNWDDDRLRSHCWQTSKGS